MNVLANKKVQPFIVGVCLSRVGKIYHFDASGIPELKIGDMVIVETSRGTQIGTVAQVIEKPDKTPDSNLKTVSRRATPRDLIQRQIMQKKESEVVLTCQKKSGDLGLKGIKVVTAEYSLDGSKLSILYGSETEEKVDLKSLRQDMQKCFSPAQVEMRQIGPRDVAKILCGMGACGLESRCCSRFLTDFSSISIKMAKEQGISLTPTEITGMCGRLRCCLAYEYEFYSSVRKQLPKRNKWVNTPLGEGKVIDVIPLRGAVLVEIPEIGQREFSGEEIKILEEPQQNIRK